MTVAETATAERPTPAAGKLVPYIAPLILPVPPAEAGRLTFGLDVQQIVDDVVVGATDFDLSYEAVLYCEGKAVGTEERGVAVRDGRAAEPVLAIDFSHDRLGYLEVSLTCDRPVFRRLHVEPGYGILKTPANGWLTVIHDVKYARPLIIESVRATAKFCAVHAAAHVDRARGLGNSYLIVNPYEKDILARLMSSSGRRSRARVPARHAAMVPLADLLDDGAWDCVMVTGNNRFPLWDVRHGHDDLWRLFSIDHLDMFRGGATHERVGGRSIVRRLARRVLRELGMRLN